MAKKKNQIRKRQSAISRSHEPKQASRKAPSRKMRATAKVQAKVKSRVVKATPKHQLHQKSPGANRSEGIRLFKVAGRPTKEQFILVYGERGPRLTWEQRAEAGVPAEKFQAVLAEKAASHAAGPKRARTAKSTATVPLAGA